MCFFHGSIKCCHDNDWNHLAGGSFAYAYYTTQQKMDHLKKAGFNISCKQAHKWVTLSVAEMEHADKPLMLLTTSDVLSGGRTNATWITHELLTEKYINVILLAFISSSIK